MPDQWIRYYASESDGITFFHGGEIHSPTHVVNVAHILRAYSFGCSMREFYCQNPTMPKVNGPFQDSEKTKRLVCIGKDTSRPLTDVEEEELVAGLLGHDYKTLFGTKEVIFKPDGRTEYIRPE